MSRTAHVDTFARDNLPPREQWPEFRYELPEFRFPDELNCASALLDDKVKAGQGERTAILSPDGRITYSQLMHQANRIARVLVEDMGLQPGNRVLVPSPNSPMMAACMLAIWKAGAIPVPTMALLRAGELTHVIRKAQISHALCDRRLAVEVEAARAGCPTLAQVRYFFDDAPDSLEQLAATKPGDFENVATAADDVGLVIFTSGTSGVPKGAMHCHRDLLAICEGFPRYLARHSQEDIVAGTPSIAFTYGLAGVFMVPLHFGSATVLIERYTPESLLETIGRYRVTLLYSVPVMYRAMASIASKYDLSSLRTCISAGEHLPVPTRAAWERATGVKIVDGIGSTEMGQIFIAAAGADIRPGATGKVVPGYQATVLDAQDEPAAAGTIGRLAVKGPTGCRYLADERQKTYVVNGWNVTGDAYYVDAEGYFYYQARADDMIVSAGYNIGGPEVENCLLAHPAVAECAVVGWPDEERGQIVKAFVVLHLGYQRNGDTVAELQDHVKRSIAPYKYPRAIEFVDTLPRTYTGKLQRYKLRPAGAKPPIGAQAVPQAPVPEGSRPAEERAAGASARPRQGRGKPTRPRQGARS
ncbi:MAG: AMP-binding protein [Burkholderiales bacterium]|nr:AMP-binding protein [Burkholderiales bacterium]